MFLKKKIKLSVIVPVYRVEQYIVRCVDSILAQKFHDIELILVDDGSPDHCPEICDKYAQKDNRVKVIHKKNGGVAAARNAGLILAQGEYITFVDSDDFIEPDMYQSMIQVADQYDCDVVMCDCIKEFGNHIEIYTHNIRSGFYNRNQLESEYFSNLLIMPNIEYPPTISNWLCIFKKNLKDAAILHYEEGIRYSEDLLFGAQMLYKAQSFYYMKGKTYYHYDCTNQQSATHIFTPDKWNDYKRLHQCIKNYFGNCLEYDFAEQIDKVLLFFVYNAVGDILKAREISVINRKRMTLEILNDTEVRLMFNRISICSLPVSIKQKLLTWCYRNKIGIKMIIFYFGRRVV